MCITHKCIYLKITFKIKKQNIIQDKFEFLLLYTLKYIEKNTAQDCWISIQSSNFI